MLFTREFGMVLSLLVGVQVGAQAQAGKYPDKPVRVVVTVPPAGASDFVARSMSDLLGKELGTTIIVDNKAGANGTIASAFVAKAPTDGYTILQAGISTHGIGPYFYEKLTYDGAKHVSVASLSKTAYDLTITINGFSKAYAMTGWRLGYLGAPEPIAKAIDAIQSHSTSNPCSFAQQGGLAALRGDQSAVEEMRAEFDLRRQYIVQRLRDIPKVTVVEPKGAFYVLANISGLGLNSTNFAERLLSKHHVAVVPGVAFGDDRTVRLSYATGLDTIKKGLDRIEEFCKSL